MVVFCISLFIEIKLQLVRWTHEQHVMCHVEENSLRDVDNIRVTFTD